MRQNLIRSLALILISVLALQMYFLIRIALMRVIDPQSTTFERSEIKRLMSGPAPLHWQQTWVDMAGLSPQLQRAVIAAEDAGFSEHNGVEWAALERAWNKNQAAQKRAQRRSQSGKLYEPKLIGNSTISQQLAKNLFLSSEKNWLRKGQELILTLELEALLPKARILEIYLNHVEWGAGVFGAQAGAARYFQSSASKLSAFPAARLAVMLPAPKRFEKNPTSDELLHRAAVIQGRMEEVSWP